MTIVPKALLAALGLVGAVAVASPWPSPTEWVARSTSAAVERPAAAVWTAPADTADVSWLPVMGLMLPASHGAGLAVGARITAIEAGGASHPRDLEIVDWVTVEAGAELPVIVVVARDVDDGITAGPRRLLRLIVKLESPNDADNSPRARVGQL